MGQGGLIWLRIGTNEFGNEPWSSTKWGNRLISWGTVNFSRKSVLHGVSWLVSWLLIYLVIYQSTRHYRMWCSQSSADFFLFAFIVFNPCFTIQAYHGVFTEFYNEFLQWCLRCTWRVSSDLVQIQVFCDFTPCRKSIVPPAVDEVCLWLCKLISRFFHRNFQHDRN